MTTTREAALEACQLCGETPKLHGAQDMGYLVTHQCSFRATDNESGPVIAAWNRRAALSTPATEPQGYVEGLEAAAKVCNERGIEEQRNFGLNRGTQNYFRARDAIRALAKGATSELVEIEALLSAGQGDDDGPGILPDMAGLTTLGKVEACLHLLELRRDVIAGYEAARPAPQPAADTRVVVVQQLERWQREWAQTLTLAQSGGGHGLAFDSDRKALDEIRAIIGTATPAPSDKIAEAARMPEVASVIDAVLPFVMMAGAMFRRNWNASDVAIALDEPNDPCRLTFDDFLDLHAAVLPFAALRALAGQGGTP